MNILNKIIIRILLIFLFYTDISFGLVNNGLLKKEDKSSNIEILNLDSEEYDEDIKKLEKNCKFLSKGSYKNVYKSIFNDERVVVALFKKRSSSKGKKLNKKLFKKNIKFFKKYKHQNIIKLIAYSIRKRLLIFECGDNDLRAFFSTKDYKKMLLSKKLDCILQIAKGLQYLHKNKIMHLDIKPENIIFIKVGDTFLFKIIDFDLYKQPNVNNSNIDYEIDYEKHCLNKKRIGSIAYSAIETFNFIDKTGLYFNTYYSDIYSLGLLLYEALSQNVFRDMILECSSKNVGTDYKFLVRFILNLDNSNYSKVLYSNFELNLEYDRCNKNDNVENYHFERLKFVNAVKTLVNKCLKVDFNKRLNINEFIQELDFLLKKVKEFRDKNILLIYDSTKLFSSDFK